MKNIDTLVEDMYKTITDGTQPSEKDMELFAERVKEGVLQLFNTRSENNNLRMSQIGKPDRQVWYQSRDITKEKLPAWAKIKFTYGHILEELLLLLAKTAGHEVKNEQKELEIEGILGHQDCEIDGVVVDCKSASAYSFKKFSNRSLLKDDPFGYIAQLSAYADAQNKKGGAFLAIDKQSGRICLMSVHDMEMINAKDRVLHLKNVVASDTIPSKCYDDIADGASGNRKLDVGCSYCAYKVNCWKDANDGKGLRKFIYANGPRYLTKVVKEPDVIEVELSDVG